MQLLIDFWLGWLTKGSISPHAPTPARRRARLQVAFRVPSLAVPEENDDSGTLPRRSPPRRPLAVRASSSARDAPGRRRRQLFNDAPCEPSRGTCGRASLTCCSFWCLLLTTPRPGSSSLSLLLKCASSSRCWSASAMRLPDTRGVVAVFGLSWTSEWIVCVSEAVGDPTASTSRQGSS